MITRRFWIAAATAAALIVGSAAPGIAETGVAEPAAAGSAHSGSVSAGAGSGPSPAAAGAGDARSAAATAAKGRLRIGVAAPRGVPARVTLVRGAKRVTVTKRASSTSRTVTKRLAAGRWKVKAPSVTVDGLKYAAKANGTRIRVRTGKTVRFTVRYRLTSYVHTGIVSGDAAGVHGTGVGTVPGNRVRVSASGRYVVFSSSTANLVRGFTGSPEAVFVRDTMTGTTRLVSVGLGGQAANGVSRNPSISDDGRFIAFESWASNLVPNDVQGMRDVFVRDMRTGATRLISHSVDAPASPASAASWNAQISGDGRFVAFESDASDLVHGDTGGYRDVFRWAMSTGKIDRVSVEDAAEYAQPSGDPAISRDGRVIAFVTSGAPSGPLTHVRDMTMSHSVSVPLGNSFRPSLSADGRYLVVSTPDPAGSHNDWAHDVYAVDLRTNTPMLVSGGFGGQAANGSAYDPAISADGRFVAFSSTASNLDPTHAPSPATEGVYVRNLAAGTTRLASLGTNGFPANGSSWSASPSADGRYVAFLSDASNLVSHDANATTDAFLVRRPGG